jgi:hypothetical protein
MKRTLAIALTISAVLAGCRPNKANVQLRKQNQELQSKVDLLSQQHAADQASLMAKDKQSGAPSTLSTEKLNQLFTVTKIDINKLTSVRPEGLKVYVTPRDEAGDPLKTAGAITVEAFDLSRSDKPLLGKFEFPAADASKHWYESIVVRGYVLLCPLQSAVTGPEINVRVTFVDSLTDRTLTAQRVIPAPPTTQPSK